MSRNRRRNAFTLIEVLIVVVIMAVLAATIIPQFSSSAKDAKESSLNFNLHTMRSQIELYKAHHLGTAPDVVSDETDGPLPQLTMATNATGTSRAAVADADHPFGPYMEEVPANAFNGLKSVGPGTAPVEDDSTGWTYDKETGDLWPNHKGWEDSQTK